MSAHPVLLLILDGWGHDAPGPYNAISMAATPHMDELSQKTHALLEASGPAVGLPEGQMGNSEVGHMALGAGRVVDQELPRLNRALAAHAFDNPDLEQQLCAHVGSGGAVHLMGLVSPGGVHSHEDHFVHVVDWLKKKGASRVFLHAILDGRDTPPRSAQPSLERMAASLSGCGGIATVMGRYDAMDRDGRWDRTERAYLALTSTHAPEAQDPFEALHATYASGCGDEFMPPTRMKGMPRLSDGDVLLYLNFRADRARSLCATFLPEFTHFERKNPPQLALLATLVPYDARFPFPSLFPARSIQDTLGEVVSRQGALQLRLAETEKYAHVTFFFNGGVEPPFPGEERHLVPSPKVTTYDQQPAMSVQALTDVLIKALSEQKHELFVCNFANADMVGHTGDLPATLEAVAAVDHAVGRLRAVCRERCVHLLITADHGNADCMFDDAKQQPHTAHTTAWVPFLHEGPAVRWLQERGTLADVAPTILRLLSYPQPAAMTGNALCAP